MRVGGPAAKNTLDQTPRPAAASAVAPTRCPAGRRGLPPAQEVRARPRVWIAAASSCANWKRPSPDRPPHSTWTAMPRPPARGAATCKTSSRIHRVESGDHRWRRRCRLGGRLRSRRRSTRRRQPDPRPGPRRRHRQGAGVTYEDNEELKASTRSPNATAIAGSSIQHLRTTTGNESSRPRCQLQLQTSNSKRSPSS